MMLGGMLSMNDTFAATSLTLTSSGSQSIDVSPATGIAISSDTINVTTTCRYGYNFTIQTSVYDNFLYLNGDPTSSANTYFSPSSGITPLNQTLDEWGYYYNGNTVPTKASIFSPVPALNDEPDIVRTPRDDPASSDIDDYFDIYYGVSVSANAEKGTYKMIPDGLGNDGTIVYTATIADACTRYTVHFSPTSEFEGNTLSGTGTMNDQTIYEGVATTLTSNGFTAPTGYYFAGWNTAQDGSGTQYANGQQVTDLTTAGNTITLYAMWTDCPPNTICYLPNVSNPSDVVGEMGNQTISSYATSAMLYAPNFSRANYGFAAWNTSPSGTGTNYGPQSTIEFTAGAYSTGGLKLYAKWVVSAGTMQSFSISNCNSMSIGDVTARKDTRDNNVYAIAKLADGKCWMIENLRLADKDGSNNNINFTDANTHNPSLPLNNSWYYKDSQTTLTTSNHLSATTDPTLWCRTASYSNCINQSMLATNNTTLFVDNVASDYSANSDVYSYGNYYNWYSATAGNGVYSTSSGDAAGDICPAGWHLPTGRDATGDFGVLDIALGGTGAESNSNTTPTGITMSLAYRSYPNNFVNSGFLAASISARNSYGDYWSSSVESRLLVYHTYFDSNMYFQPGTATQNKPDGAAVRCIAGT